MADDVVERLRTLAKNPSNVKTLYVRNALLEASDKIKSQDRRVAELEAELACRSPSPGAEAARREAIEACIATVDLACKANFMMRGGLLLDVLVERLRALSPPVEGE